MNAGIYDVELRIYDVELRKRALVCSRWTLRGAEFPILTKLCETGAIKKIKRLVSEFHVWHDKMDEFVKILGLLRSNKLQFSTRLPGPILDWQPRKRLLKSLSESRFSSICLQWHSPKENAPASEYQSDRAVKAANC